MDNRPLDNKLLLLNSIVLLYRESQLAGISERSGALVKNALSLVRLPENIQLSLDPLSQTLDGLKRMAIGMCDDPEGQTYEEVDMLQSLKLICNEDLSFYESFEKGITAELKEASVKKTCVNMRRALKNQLRNEGVKAIVHKAHVQIVFKPDTIADMRKFTTALISELEPYQQDQLTQDPAILNTVRFGDRQSISNMYAQVQKEADGSAILQTGWQGINRMTRGGFRRGEQWVFPALPHMNKSGLVLDFFRQIPQYNVPLMIDPSKQALNLFFTFENSTEQNMRYIFAKLKANENGTFISEEELASMDPDVIADYVYTALAVNGYQSIMERVNPSGWGYLDMCNRVMEYEAEGYEVHSCFADYLYMLPTTGCTQGPLGHDVRDMFRRVRNWMAARKIFFGTPHQISTDGKRKIREGATDFVKTLPGMGYYAGSSQIDQEVDGEIFLHIEKINGKSYQTYQRGKHRIVGQTPGIDQYCVHEFDPKLGILDDVGRPDRTLRRPGGGVVGSGNENPFWEHEPRADSLFA